MNKLIFTLFFFIDTTLIQAKVAAMAYRQTGGTITVHGMFHMLQLACILALGLLCYSLYKKRKRFKNKIKELKMIEEDVITRLLDTLSANFAFVDSEGIILYLNQRVFKELDMHRKDMIGKKITDMISIFSGKNDILPDVLTRIAKGEEHIDFTEDTFVYDKKHNVAMLVEGSVFGIKNRKGELLNILFFLRNMTEKRKDEYTMNMILNSTNIYPWTIDLRTSAFTIDPRYYDYLGVNRSNRIITVDDFQKQIHPDDFDVIMKALDKLSTGKSSGISVPYRILRGDGTYEWFEVQSTSLENVSDTPAQLIGICLSTQKYKDTEIRLQEALECAQRSERLKSAFLANMSHEIRTPLNAIMGFSNLLTSGDMDLSSDEAKEYSEIIDRNGRYLLSLISDILDLSRIESDTIRFDMQLHSLNELLTDVYRTQSVSMSPDVTLVLDIPSSDTTIRTDAVRITQVINNLVGNAKKFTKKGSITLGYHLENDGGEIDLFVRDTGCGIEPEELPLIFDRFYKGRSHKQGTGLGLSICKTIVEKLNGNITVTSEREIGSAFIIKVFNGGNP